MGELTVIAGEPSLCTVNVVVVRNSSLSGVSFLLTQVTGFTHDRNDYTVKIPKCAKGKSLHGIEAIKMLA